MQGLTLRLHQALGDAVCFTALIRDLKRQHPQYRIHLDVNWKPVWQDNPHAQLGGGTNRVEIGYTAGVQLSKTGEPVHLIRAMANDLKAKTGLNVDIEEPRGELFLPAGARTSPVAGRYWVVFAGGKLDMTVKHWHTSRYQEVVDRLKAYGIPCVQAGAAAVGHVHPPLKNVLSAIGHTENPVDMFRLLKHADGVICGVTGAMHVAAALNKPCVVIAGGREEPSFFGYTNDRLAESFGPKCERVEVEHKILHTVGLIHCCDKRGCWRKRTVAIDAKDVGRKDRICLEPVRTGDHPVPLCQDMIQTDHVVEAVMSYYEDNVIPPIGRTTGKYPLPTVEATTTLVNQTTLSDINRAWGPAQPAIDHVQACKDIATISEMLPKIATKLGIELPPGPPPQLLFASQPTLPPRPQPLTSVALPGELPSRAAMPATVIDHPIIGGKYTCFVLCYGDHFDLAKRCIDSILNTAPVGTIDLRVGANACCDKTLHYLRGLPTGRLYISQENIKKYPMMRQMFHDPNCPIETPYFLWFDDDSYVTHPRWLEMLSEEIVANHNFGGRQYGWLHIHDTKMYAKNGHDPRKWFEQATWWRGRNFRVRGTKTEAPNGTVIEFIPGSFWAMHTQTMREADIPCTRLNHCGGDITISEQLHQAGWKAVSFNKNRQYVYMSGSPRRGVTEGFQWAGRPG